MTIPGWKSRPRQTVIGDIVDVAEIARRLEVPKRNVERWRDRGRFPAPDKRLDVGPLWLWETVERWARETGRL